MNMFKAQSKTPLTHPKEESIIVPVTSTILCLHDILKQSQEPCYVATPTYECNRVVKKGFSNIEITCKLWITYHSPIMEQTKLLKYHTTEILTYENTKRNSITDNIC